MIIKSGEHPDLEKMWMEKAEKQLARFHPNRLKEWVNGRVALTMAFKRMNIDITPKDEFLGYQKIKGQEKYTFSISHTPGWAGAIVVAGNVQPGLDIESLDREIDEKILERFIHPYDGKFEPLVLWTAKEAAYKSLPDTVQQKFWLQSIQISEGKFSGDGFHGVWSRIDHPELMIIEASRAL